MSLLLKLDYFRKYTEQPNIEKKTKSYKLFIHFMYYAHIWQTELIMERSYLSKYFISATSKHIPIEHVFGCILKSVTHILLYVEVSGNSHDYSNFSVNTTTLSSQTINLPFQIGNFYKIIWLKHTVHAHFCSGIVESNTIVLKCPPPLFKAKLQTCIMLYFRSYLYTSTLGGSLLVGKESCHSTSFIVLSDERLGL
jgi:hypothetical protein